MEENSAKYLIQNTLQNSFDKERFIYLAKNILNHIEDAPFVYKGNLIFDDFADSIKIVERIGKYKDPEGKLIDILIVQLQKETSLERARTKQRNFIAKYLKGSRGGVLKDAALVAFVSPNGDDWRFSLVKMEYKFNEKGKVEEEFTPARRYSFLVGKNENSHTARSRLLPLLLNDEVNPSLKELEDAFSVEKVTKEFFEKYRDLFLRLKETLDEIVKKDTKVKEDFNLKNINTVDFAKKLLGQIVFLYFLQKKGWFGVARDAEWGSGSKHFLRELFEKKHGDYKNFFNDILEPLFYEVLRLERPGDYYSRFNCRIPFLNGGLFDPINDYDWWNTDILLPDDIFSNDRKTKEDDVGDGILDVFDRYNFTVKEDEPLEKEVAIDPEMLGKVFENLLEVKDRKSKGTYYTPREIVHYMCQESLTNYLATELEGKICKEDIETLIKYGESVVEHDSHVVNEGRETDHYTFKLPQSVRKHAKLIDDKLDLIRVCDPAVGSGAFPVGMMSEIIRTRNALTPYTGKNSERTPYHFKRQAIQNCLYGVDIDPGAVEIAKLRLWLSLIVDEEEREKIQPLPNLDYKIVQGNSLLGFPYTPMGLEKIEQLKQNFFEETRPKIKDQLKGEIDEAIKKLLANTERALGYKVDFDFKIFFSEVFHEKKGFDVVIANPPYVDSETMVRLMPKFREVLAKSYTTAKGNWDLYIPFWELGIKLLNNNGNSVFITPNKWLSIGYGKNLRELLRPYLYKIGNCDKVKVFETGNSPVIVFVSKSSHDEIQVDRFDFGYNISKQVVSQKSGLTKESWGFLLSSNLNLLLKLMKNPRKIGQDYYTENPFTVSEAYEVQKILYEIKPSEHFDALKYFKFVNTGTIEKYYFLWSLKTTTYLKKKYLTPVIERDTFKKNFPKRFDQMSTPKIVISGMRHFECALDQSGDIVAGKSTIILKNKNDTDLKTILALLNSSLISFFIKEAFGVLGIGGGINFTAEIIENLPFPEIDDEKKGKLNSLTDSILKIIEPKNWPNKIGEQAKVREYERQIDQLVYQLYDLTPEEIKIVENSS